MSDQGKKGKNLIMKLKRIKMTRSLEKHSLADVTAYYEKRLNIIRNTLKSVRENNRDLAKHLTDQKVLAQQWYDETVVLKKKLVLAHEELVAYQLNESGNRDAALKKEAERKLSVISEPVLQAIQSSLDDAITLSDNLTSVKELIISLFDDSDFSSDVSVNKSTSSLLLCNNTGKYNRSQPVKNFFNSSLKLNKENSNKGNPTIDCDNFDECIIEEEEAEMEMLKSEECIDVPNSIEKSIDERPMTRTSLDMDSNFISKRSRTKSQKISHSRTSIVSPRQSVSLPKSEGKRSKASVSKISAEENTPTLSSAGALTPPQLCTNPAVTTGTTACAERSPTDLNATLNITSLLSADNNISSPIAETPVLYEKMEPESPNIGSVTEIRTYKKKRKSSQRLRNSVESCRKRKSSPIPLRMKKTKESIGSSRKIKSSPAPLKIRKTDCKLLLESKSPDDNYSIISPVKKKETKILPNEFVKEVTETADELYGVNTSMELTEIADSTPQRVPEIKKRTYIYNYIDIPDEASMGTESSKHQFPPDLNISSLAKSDMFAEKYSPSHKINSPLRDLSILNCSSPDQSVDENICNSPQTVIKVNKNEKENFNEENSESIFKPCRLSDTLEIAKLKKRQTKSRNTKSVVCSDEDKLFLSEQVMMENNESKTPVSRRRCQTDQNISQKISPKKCRKSSKKNPSRATINNKNNVEESLLALDPICMSPFSVAEQSSSRAKSLSRNVISQNRMSIVSFSPKNVQIQQRESETAIKPLSRKSKLKNRVSFAVDAKETTSPIKIKEDDITQTSIKNSEIFKPSFKNDRKSKVPSFIIESVCADKEHKKKRKIPSKTNESSPVKKKLKTKRSTVQTTSSKVVDASDSNFSTSETVSTNYDTETHKSVINGNSNNNITSNSNKESLPKALPRLSLRSSNVNTEDGIFKEVSNKTKGYKTDGSSVDIDNEPIINSNATFSKENENAIVESEIHNESFPITVSNVEIDSLTSEKQNELSVVNEMNIHNTEKSKLKRKKSIKDSSNSHCQVEISKQNLPENGLNENKRTKSTFRLKSEKTNYLEESVSESKKSLGIKGKCFENIDTMDHSYVSDLAKTNKKSCKEKSQNYLEPPNLTAYISIKQETVLIAENCKKSERKSSRKTKEKEDSSVKYLPEPDENSDISKLPPKVSIAADNSEIDTEANTDMPRRRRAAANVSYKEPKIGGKLRQGDNGSSIYSDFKPGVKAKTVKKKKGKK